MHRAGPMLIAVSLLVCTKAPAPLIAMDKAALSAVRRIAVLPVDNATGYNEVNPLFERLLLTELISLRRFEFVTPTEVTAALNELKLSGEDLGNPFNIKLLGERLRADAVIGAAVTVYSPFGTETALLGKESQKAEKDIKPPSGIIGWLVPNRVSASETEYHYGTVTREPALGALISIIRVADARVIFESSKLIQGDARVPGSYRLTYSGVLTKDELRRVDLIGRLVVREMLEPLRGEL